MTIMILMMMVLMMTTTLMVMMIKPKYDRMRVITMSCHDEND